MTDWTEATWLASANEWINAQLVQIGREVDGEIEQPHVRPWSTVMRVPTREGPVWFKANIQRLAYEAQVLKLLAQQPRDVDADAHAPRIRLQMFLEGMPPTW